MLRTLLSVGIFLLTLAACVWATVAISRGPIERDLTKRTLESLEEIEDFRGEYCEVEFVGLNGVVRAELQTEDQRNAVEEKIARIYGTRVITTELTVVPFDEPWILVGPDDSGEMRAEGLLATGAERDVLNAALGSSIGQQIEVREKVKPAVWVERLGKVASELLPVADGASLELREGKLKIAGEMPDPESHLKLSAVVTGAFPGVVSALTVAPPPEPSGFEMSPPRDGEMVVAGRLADLESAEKLLSLLRSSGDWIIKDQIVVAENTTAAPWVESLTFLLPSVLGEVIGAGVKFDGRVLRLEGQVSEDMSEAIDSVAKQNFPAPDYTVQNRLRIMTPPREAMVSIMTLPDGQVKLKGLLASAELKERIAKAVEGSMSTGGELLTDELQVDPNVMDAVWVDALVKLVPPYVQQVKRGALTIYSNILAVDAVINSDAERDAIWAMTEQYFPDESYRRLLELRFPEEVEGGIVSEGEAPPGE